MNFVEIWGTEIAMSIGVLGSLFILWLTWPERREKKNIGWRLSVTATSLATVGVGMYLYLGLNGVWL